MGKILSELINKARTFRMNRMLGSVDSAKA